MNSPISPEALVLDLCLHGHAEEGVIVLVNPGQVRFRAAADNGHEPGVVRAQALARPTDVSGVRLPKKERRLSRGGGGGWGGVFISSIAVSLTEN